MSDLAPQTEQARFVRVVDCETSGLPEDEQHGLVELGWWDLDLKSLTVASPVTFFVNPGHPIPPHVRAVHHISDQDVAAAMPADQATALLLKDMGQADVLCAHRASYEQHFIDAGSRRWVCSWKCGMRAWQDAVSHGNQALRYLSGIDSEPDFNPAFAQPAHRALPDAYVTAFLLRQLLRMRPLERLVEITTEPPLSLKVNFGKHKGQKWSELPGGYLDWIIDKSDMDEDVKGQARFWLSRKAAA